MVEDDVRGAVANQSRRGRATPIEGKGRRLVTGHHNRSARMAVRFACCPGIGIVLGLRDLDRVGLLAAVLSGKRPAELESRAALIHLRDELLGAQFCLTGPAAGGGERDGEKGDEGRRTATRERHAVISSIPPMKPSCQAAALALCVVVLAACGGQEDGGPDRPARDSGQSTADSGGSTDLELVPSARARREIPTTRLRRYRDAAREAGVDWSVVAAVDRVERGRSDPLGIAYTLSGLGAPDSYETALRQRGGNLAYAEQVLQIADKYRRPPGGKSRLPAAEAPLLRPVGGVVLSAFGERFGFFHDGAVLAAAPGTTVRAVAHGLVVHTDAQRASGGLVCVLHRFSPPLRGKETLTSCYGNLGRLAVGEGEKVKRGSELGRAECSGACLSPGLQFEIRDGSGPSAPAVDPIPFLEAPAKPRDRDRRPDRKR